MTNTAHSAYANLVAKVNADPAYKQQLIDNPVATLRAAGIAVADGIKITPIFDSAEHIHFRIPAVSSNGEIREEELASLSGGFYIGGWGHGARIG